MNGGRKAFLNKEGLRLSSSDFSYTPQAEFPRNGRKEKRANQTEVILTAHPASTESPQSISQNRTNKSSIGDWIWVW